MALGSWVPRQLQLGPAQYHRAVYNDTLRLYQPKNWRATENDSQAIGTALDS